MREVKFTPLALSQLNDWKRNERKIYSRIELLIVNIQENPFSGIGKPEPLRHELTGYWSRRINAEHRLVYKITSNTIIVIACKYHY